MEIAEYGHVATVHESAGELRTLFVEVEEYFDGGAVLAAGSTVVDVGANIGAFAIAAARRCHRDLKLICCEPVPALYRALSENLQKNHWLSGGKHLALNVALSTTEDAGKTCDFYYFRRFPRDSTMDLRGKRREFEAFFAAQGARIGKSVGFLGPGARLIEKGIASIPRGPVGHWLTDRVTGLETTQVPLDTLANVLRQQSVARVDLLKVDVEGAELKVLAGLDAGTWPKIRQVAIECDGTEERTRELLALLSAHGFTAVKKFEPPTTVERGLPNLLLHGLNTLPLAA